MKKLLDFTECTNPAGPSNRAKNAIRKGIKRLHHPPGMQHKRLKKYIAGTEGLEEKNLFFSHGSEGIIPTILKALGVRSVSLPPLLPPSYLSAFQPGQLDIVQIRPGKEGPFQIDRDGLLDSLAAPGTVCLPSPHPVTGAVLDEKILAALLEEAERKETVLILDEACSGYADLVSPAKVLAESGWGVTVRTFSDFYAMPGMSFGYVVAPGWVIEKLIGMTGPERISSLAAEAALASLRDRGYKKRTAEFLKAEKSYLGKRLETINGIAVFDTPCSFLMLKITWNGPGLLKEMHARGIAVEVLRLDDGNFAVPLPVRKHRENAFFARTMGRIMGGR